MIKRYNQEKLNPEKIAEIEEKLKEITNDNKYDYFDYLKQKVKDINNDIEINTNILNDLKNNQPINMLAKMNDFFSKNKKKILGQKDGDATINDLENYIINLEEIKVRIENVLNEPNQTYGGKRKTRRRRYKNKTNKKRGKTCRYYRRR